MEHRTNTKQRILEAAGRVFSENGYRQSTVREICSYAGVNIAAINYYFQGKENLYIETLRYWKNIAFEKYPRELGTSENNTPEERLKGFIRSFVFRILDTGRESCIGRLMLKEYADPTGALNVMVEEVIRPMFTFLSTIVGQIISSDPSGALVRSCCSSIVSQCAFFLYARPVIRRLVGDEQMGPTDIEGITDHIFRFSLAALLAMKQSREGTT